MVTIVTNYLVKKILQEYLRKENYPIIEEEFRGFSINYDYKGYRFNNIFLAGDAAGLESKTTGERIAYALTSGKEMAKKILNPEYLIQEFKKILTF